MSTRPRQVALVGPTHRRIRATILATGALGQAHYCPDHARERQQRYDRERGSASARGYDSRCVAAVVVDHTGPHKGARALFWDRGNWQSLC
jgi:hypothetical protein